MSCGPTQPPDRGTSVLLEAVRRLDLPNGVSGRSEVWCAAVDAVAADAVEEDGLGADECRRAASFRHPADRHEYVVAHLILRSLLGRRLGRPGDELTFRRAPCPACGGPHGRPEVDTDPLPVHFSLSHGAGLVLVALAEDPVGVDVEAVPTDDTVRSVAPTLPRAERAAIAAMAGPGQPVAFARAWARLEAYLKGVGTGIAVDLGPIDLAAAQADGWVIADLDVRLEAAAAVALSPRAGT